MTQKVIFSAVLACALAAPGLSAADDLRPGEYYTLEDGAGAVILLTAFPVSAGDVYIAPDNTRYAVERLDGLTAVCRREGRETMPEPEGERQATSAENALMVAAEASAKIALYHTHSDESYLPSDGAESTPGNGGIHEVGQALSDQLSALGFEVMYDRENHNPHDGNAYARSRRTAAALLRGGADVIIDVHRDAVPAEVYAAEVNGEDVARIKLVVGRSNPGMSNNLEFAKRLKAELDRNAPGLSGGIYMGKGSYNQDLSPRAILIEAGAHTNGKEEAAKGARMFADAAQAVLKLDAGAGEAGEEDTEKAGGPWAAAGLLLLVVALAAGGLYWVNHPAGKV
jgi:stage II sporulation protein P